MNRMFCMPWRRPVLAAMLAFGLLLPALALAQTPLATPAPAAVPAAAAPSLAPPPALPAGDIALRLPRDLSPWGMFMAADIVVKAVMVGLAFASVLTWTIWFAKAIELMAARRRLRTAIDALNGAHTWSEATARLQGANDGAAVLLRAADAELRLSADALSANGVKERIASRLERL